MKQYSKKSELALGDPLINEKTMKLWNEVLEAIEETDGTILEGEEADDLNYVLGGDVFVVETLEDLKEIEHVDGNVFDSPGVFDGASMIADGAYAELFLVCNNAGGPVFYVPKAIYEQAPNVEASIRATEKYWASTEKSDSSN